MNTKSVNDTESNDLKWHKLILSRTLLYQKIRKIRQPLQPKTTNVIDPPSLNTEKPNWMTISNEMPQFMQQQRRKNINTNVLGSWPPNSFDSPPKKHESNEQKSPGSNDILMSSKTTPPKRKQEKLPPILQDAYKPSKKFRMMGDLLVMQLAMIQKFNKFVAFLTTVKETSKHVKFLYKLVVIKVLKI